MSLGKFLRRVILAHCYKRTLETLLRVAPFGGWADDEGWEKEGLK